VPYHLVARNARGRVIASVPLGQRPLSIGRGPECGIVLPSTAVSRRHASVQLQRDGRVLLKDEGSANGVKLDGQFISGPTLVGEGSRIEISDFLLQLESADAAVEEPIQALHTDPASQTIAHPKLGRDKPDRPEEEMSFDTILEPQAASGAVLASGKLKLVGKGGPYDGTVLKLEKALLVVGRTAESDLTLEDPSISRRHSQIRLSLRGDSFTVLDLRSSNGTFVDGQRVKRAECRPGQVVRFGDLAFKVTLEEAAAPKTKGAPRRRLLIAASLLLCVLGGVAGLAYLKRPRKPKDVVVTPEQKLRELQAEVQRSVDEARRRLQQREWTQAIVELDLAKSKDPLNAEVPKLRQMALDELEQERTYRKGMEFFALGNRENLIKAREIFEKVPSSSVYHREIRYKIKAIDERVAEDYRIEGVSRCEKNYWGECQTALCKFFELMPAETAVDGESRLREMLKEAEKRLSRKKGFVGCQARRFLETTPKVAGGTDVAALLDEKYGVEEIRDVLLAYVEGKLDIALKRLVVARGDKRLRPNLTAINEINRQLLIIKGKYQEGYSAYRERDVTKARVNWDLVLAADASLLPTGVESFYRREVTRALGDLYFELGDEQSKAGRLRLAFEMWSKGKLVDLRHERILNGLLQLESEADKLIKAGQKLAGEGQISDARTKLSMARDITEASRPMHKEAERVLGELGQ
jgi:ABC transport system ATP-binding/permease protein